MHFELNEGADIDIYSMTLCRRFRFFLLVSCIIRAEWQLKLCKAGLIKFIYHESIRDFYHFKKCISYQVILIFLKITYFCVNVNRCNKFTKCTLLLQSSTTVKYLIEICLFKCNCINCFVN